MTLLIVKNRLTYLLSCLLIIAFVVFVEAHENQHHSAASTKPVAQRPEVKDILAQINADYIQSIKPIFVKSCFSCHASSPTLPWYSELPGAKQLMQNDMTEAKKHLDFSNDFPFVGHGSPVEDLKAIARSVKNGDMPPLRYRLMHWSSGLTSEEKTRIASWIERSVNLINE